MKPGEEDRVCINGGGILSFKDFVLIPGLFDGIVSSREIMNVKAGNEG